jgi:hypothetical protein
MFELVCFAAALGTVGYWLGKLLVAADGATIDALDAELRAKEVERLLAE